MAKPASSIHLWASSENIEDDVSYRRSAIIHASYPSTYFSLITTSGSGHDGGYGGIQEKANGEKVAIFSLWNDAKTNSDVFNVPNPVNPVETFGGEGTGRKCMIDYDWEIGEEVMFMINTKLIKNWYYYSGFIKKRDENCWTEIATYKRHQRGGHPAVSTGAFIEDWDRSDDNPNGMLRERSASYGALEVVRVGNRFCPSNLRVANYRFSTVTSGFDEHGSNRTSACSNGYLFYLRTGGNISCSGPVSRNLRLSCFNQDKSLTHQKCYCCDRVSVSPAKNFCKSDSNGENFCAYNQCQKVKMGRRCIKPIEYKGDGEGLFCFECEAE